MGSVSGSLLLGCMAAQGRLSPRGCGVVQDDTMLLLGLPRPEGAVLVIWELVMEHRSLSWFPVRVIQPLGFLCVFCYS